MCKIEKGIPIPKNELYNKPGYYKRIYPANMEIGDSFLVPIENPDKTIIRRKRQSIMGCYRRERFKNQKYFTKYIKEEKGIRTWRIK